MRRAFNLGIISNGELWMEMIEDRNQTSGLYDEEKSNLICTRIVDKYLELFENLKTTLEQYE